MGEIIKVKNVTIGEGIPKICVPLVGRTLTELLEEATEFRGLDIDIVEWRVDFFEHVEELEKVKEALIEIRKGLGNLPLIFTFRSAKEGGEKEISKTYYMELNKTMAESSLVDIIDVELFNDPEILRSLVDVAHEHQVYVIISNHDFHGTPPKEEIIARLQKAQEFGGDLPKIAVMPKDAADVLTLLDATLTMKEHYANRPIITMSMAGKGVISRLSGEIFGSALTFGAAKKASAPGQLEVKELRHVLSLLHENI